MTTQPSSRKWHVVIALAIVILDRITKWGVQRHITLHDTISVIPGFFQLTHIENTGAAFGLFANSSSSLKLVVLIAFSIVALAVVVVLLWRSNYAHWTTGVALSLILGGAIGNLWDRLIAGRVVDFLELYVRSFHWPAFNVADSAIVVGAFLLMSEILFSKAPATKTVS